jgi:hypothetical protein
MTYGLQELAQKDQGGNAVLTEGSGQAGTRRRGDLGGAWRRGRPALVGKEPWGALQGSWHLSQRRTRAVKVVPGSEGPKMRRQG